MLVVLILLYINPLIYKQIQNYLEKKKSIVIIKIEGLYDKFKKCA